MDLNKKYSRLSKYFSGRLFVYPYGMYGFV